MSTIVKTAKTLGINTCGFLMTDALKPIKINCNSTYLRKSWENNIV